MTDILTPTDPAFSPLGPGQAGALRPRFGGGLNIPGAPAYTGEVGDPVADRWYNDWKAKNGFADNPADAQLLRSLVSAFQGEQMPGLAVRAPAPPVVDLDFRGIDKTIAPDPLMALKHGFAASSMGAIQRWLSMDTPNFKQDPSYSHWDDPMIKESIFKDRPELFELSQSQEQSRWIIGYMKRHEKEARLLEGMTGNMGIFEMAGTMLGDPLLYTPATLGIKAGKLAASATHLASPGTMALGFKPVVWGGLQDGLRAVAAQSAVALVDAGLHRSLDTTANHGSIADIVALPSAIAGAVGFLSGSYTRYGIGMDALKRAHGNEEFLAGTRIKGVRTSAGGPVQPGVLSEAEEAYWQAAARKNPDGRFHIDGMVRGFDGETVLFRTSEGLDVEIPALKIDHVSGGKGSQGIVVSSDMLAGSKALQASAMDLDGPFLGGNYVHSLTDQLKAAVKPGALATGYPAMRIKELISSGTFGSLKATEDPDFTIFMAGNRVVGPDGQPIRVYHGTRSVFDQFENEKLGSNTGSPSAFQGHFFASNPAVAGEGRVYGGVQRIDPQVQGYRQNSLIDRLKGKGKHRAIMSEEQFIGEGANVRPTYLRMTNPLVLDDAAVKDFSAGEYGALWRANAGGAGAMPPVKDIHGNYWASRLTPEGQILRDKAELVGQAERRAVFADPKNLHWVEIDGPELFKNKPTGRTSDTIQTVAGHDNASRLHNYAQSAKKAREAGHDGVIIRNTSDGTHDLTNIYIVFDPKTQIRGFDQRYALVGKDTIDLDDVNISRGSLSAGNVGAGIDINSRRAMLEGNRMVASGIGIEKLPFDVMNRAAMLPFTTWQTTVGDMLSVGGRIHVRNTKAGGYTANAIPVETLIKTEWMKPTYDVIRGIRDEWQLARAGHMPGERSDLQSSWFEAKTTFNDWRGKSKGIGFEDFRRRVGDATFNGDKDLLSDQYTDAINRSAAQTRKLWERIKQEGMDVGIFKEAHQEQLGKAEARLAAAKKNNLSGDSILAAEKHLEHVKQLLHEVITGGPRVHTAKSYRPRVWLQDQLRDRADEFKGIVDNWLRNSNPNLSAAERQKIAENIHETLTKDRPVWTKKEIEQNFNDLADPSSAKARTLMIPDMLVKDFLENDIESLVRHHSRVMGTGIEMHRRFGSTGMEDEIGEIWNEAKLLLNAAPDNAAKKQIIKQRDLAIADLEASRDRLYGSYGAPEDPHRWQSRTIRMAKQFTNITVLGMAGVTAMADLVRPLMTEGLQAMNDYGFRSLASESRASILKLSRKELELAGDAMELIANTRALSMSDTGDMFRSRSSFERGLAKTNSWFFVANGLNAINQIDKEWAGLVIQGNVNRALKNMTGSNPGRVPEWMKVRLAANGIDEPMALRIADQMRRGGQNNFGKLLLADTLKWTDEEAVKVYRTALNQMVNRTVPTPTLADTPNWFSSELGGLMMQYKAFSFGAMNRTLLSGLQEESRQFWYGAAAMTGFALILNEMRSRLFYDRSTFDRPMTATLMDAVDRSSVLGWFSDANRAIEILTGHRAGVRPLVGAERPRVDPADRILGTAAGPAVGQAVNALSVLGDFLAMHPTVKTMADARKMIPGQNIPYLDPVFDHLVSDGSWYPKKPSKKEKEATVNRRRVNELENVRP
jgi:hypothetical protein